MTYFLDANVFIESKKNFYAPDICPAFWQWLSDEGSVNPSIRSISNVLDELKAGSDDLPRWAREKFPANFFVSTSRDKEIVEEHCRMQDKLVSSGKWEGSRLRSFIVTADLWLIATAKVLGGCVVTNERVVPGQHRIKIPNVASFFTVPCCTIYDVMRSLGVRLYAYDRNGVKQELVNGNGRLAAKTKPSFF